MTAKDFTEFHALVEQFQGELSRYIEFPSLLVGLLSNKGRGGEDEAELVNFTQLLTKLLKRINREARGGNGHATARFDGRHQIVPKCLIDIINELRLHYGVTRFSAIDSIMAN